MKIVLSNHSGVPIYEQIKSQIKDAILSNELKEEEQLLSIRQLAKDLKISVITTTRAYNDLEEEGFIASVQGKGCYILPQNKEIVHENVLRKIETSFNDAIVTAKTSGITRQEMIEMLNLLYDEGDIV